MTPTPPKPPTYRRHKATGQAVVTLDGRDFYLGPHGTRRSIDAYNRLVAEWQANGGRLPRTADAPPPTVNMLIERYWTEHVTGYYVKDGRPTSEPSAIKLAFRPLVRLYGDLPATEFSPLKLEAVRNAMIQGGWARKTVNTGVSRIKLLFRWAAAKELLPESVHSALTKLPGLRKGRSPARETEPVRPVPQPFIDAVRPLVSRQVRAMIDLQLLTGMRSGEVVIMRGCDLDTTGRTWVYVPSRHKTEHHGKVREVHIGPRAQAVIAGFLKADTGAYLFSPADAERERHEAMAKARKTRRQPSQVKRHERAMRRAAKGRRRRAPQDRYTVNSYRRAIERACVVAFPTPEGLDAQAAAAWRRDHHWSPHRLRHNAATALRRQYGIEIARIVLGHHSALVTEVYAELDREAAAKAMSEVG